MPSAPLSRITLVPLIVLPLLISADAPSTRPAAHPAPPAGTSSAANYHWRLINDAVGAPCSGIFFNSQDPSFRYCYGDTGGYRWDALMQRWTSFTDWNPDPQYGHVVGLALDPNDRSNVYYAAGTTHGEVFKSTDHGITFTATGLKRADGGAVSLVAPTDAPGSADHVVVDGTNSSIVYLASRTDGLFINTHGGETGAWKQVDSFTARGDVNEVRGAKGEILHRPAGNGGLSLVAFDRRGGTIEIDGVRRTRVVFVGVVGDRRIASGNSVSRVRESGLWRSSDGGKTWSRLSGPMNADNVPTHAQVAADGDLWATISGRIVNVARGGAAATDLGAPLGRNGLVAMAVDRLDPDHAVVARYGDAGDRAYGDENRLFRTTDGGATWTELKIAATTPPWWGKFATRTAVLRFEPNSPKDAHGRSRTLWLGDELGPWVCEDLDAEVTHWRLISRGRGGAFVPAMVCPPPQPGTSTAPLLAAVGGFGGFRYLGVTAIPESAIHISAKAGEPAMTISGFSLCESQPKFVVATGAIPGQAGSIGAISSDNGVTWQPLIDRLASTGAVSTGSVCPIAIGCDSQNNRSPNLVRWPAGAPPRYSNDGGQTWIGGSGAPAAPAAAGDPSLLRTLAADPLEPKTFYLCTTGGAKATDAKLYVSRDAGATWTAAGDLPAAARSDRAVVTLRAAPGAAGDLWLGVAPAFGSAASQPAVQAVGLYRSIDGGKNWKPVAGWQTVYDVAFGAARPGGTHPTVVISGIFSGNVSIQISDDAVEALGTAGGEPHWRIAWRSDSTDTPALVRCLRCIAADRQAYGRIYAGGSDAPRGLFYGEPSPQTAPAAPTNVIARSSPAGMSLEWTDPVSAAEYDVQRTSADKPDEWTTVITSSWYSRVIDSSAKSGTAYLYRVVASNALGRSEPSEPVKAR